MIDTGNLIVNLHGFPEEEADEIKRCLATLYSVREGEQPLNREFGLNTAFLDYPMPIAQNMFALEVVEKTKKFVPRVKVEEVSYKYGEAGQMIPIINLGRSLQA